MGSWDPGTLGPWVSRTLGPQNPRKLGSWDPGTQGSWDPGTVGRASGHQVEQGLLLAPPCRLHGAMRITVLVSSPLIRAKASPRGTGMQRAATEAGRRGP